MSSSIPILRPGFLTKTNMIGHSFGQGCSKKRSNWFKTIKRRTRKLRKLCLIWLSTTNIRFQLKTHKKYPILLERGCFYKREFMPLPSKWITWIQISILAMLIPFIFQYVERANQASLSLPLLGSFYCQSIYLQFYVI